jgi:prepilin-type processing-associated H-X9-DG protein
MFVGDSGTYPGPTNVWQDLAPTVGAKLPDQNVFPDPQTQIWNYLGPRNSVYVCPGYNRVRGAVGIQSYSAGIWHVECTGYGYNTSGIGARNAAANLGLGGKLLGPDGAGTWVPIRESNVVRPVDMIALGDAVLNPGYSPPPSDIGWGEPELSFGINYDGFYNRLVRMLPSADPGVQRVRRRHNARWNVAFCDGHVETLSGRQLFDYGDDGVLRRWNNDNQPHRELAEPVPPEP